MSRITEVKIRRGTSAAWSSTNPVLSDGEPGWDTDTKLLKFGDGTTNWNSLPYSGIPASDKGAASGVATLNSNGIVPFAQQPFVLRSITLSVTAQSGITGNITFPAGLFSSIPVVLVSKTGGGLAKFVPYAVSVTTSGCTVGIFSGDGTTATGNVPVQVVAFPAS